MNALTSFVAKFTVVEGVTAAVSLLALLVSGIAVVYARRSAAAAERSADAAIRQADIAERLEQHTRAQLRPERMRAREKYRKAANEIAANLTRIRNLLADSHMDLHIASYMLTADALTELRVLSVEGSVPLDLDSLMPTIDAPPSLISQGPIFPLSERQTHMDRMDAVSRALRRSIQEAEQAERQS